MQHRNTLILTQSALTVIDMQEAFRSKIPDFSEVAERIATTVKAATILRLPIIVTEQYPKGLGHTASEILEVLPPTTEIIEKTTFSSCGVRPFQSQLDAVGAKQVMVCGIEAHLRQPDRARSARIWTAGASVNRLHHLAKEGE